MNGILSRRRLLGASAIGATGYLTGLAWRGEMQPVAARAQEATTVTLESWSPIQQTTDKMIAAFAAEHPDISVERTILNYPDYILDIKTRAASDSLPDIIGLEPGALTQEYRQFLIPWKTSRPRSGVTIGRATFSRSGSIRPVSAILPATRVFTGCRC